jgi:hypothetical protein
MLTRAPISHDQAVPADATATALVKNKCFSFILFFSR